MRLHTLIASTRPNRVGPVFANWFHAHAQKHGKFDAHLVDLAEFNLPVFDEPEHPRLGKYAHEHTKKWSASVAAADAFVFVTPEYNYSTPPALLNAFNFLHAEWAYKPVAFVAYGGMAAGLRGVQATKLLVTSLKMMPIPEAVAFPWFTQHLKDGVLTATDQQNASAVTTLNELHKWAQALKGLRA